MANRSISCYLY